mmetsp:Transcript_44658/g.87478  ORF Transcript_44658/g.87478 Transcript_44658/m.87478 type:complete len:317 (-) Transcript_44658:1637-2587(-)
MVVAWAKMTSRATASLRATQSSFSTRYLALKTTLTASVFSKPNESNSCTSASSHLLWGYGSCSANRALASAPTPISLATSATTSEAELLLSKVISMLRGVPKPSTMVMRRVMYLRAYTSTAGNTLGDPGCCCCRPHSASVSVCASHPRGPSIARLCRSNTPAPLSCSAASSWAYSRFRAASSTMTASIFWRTLARAMAVETLALPTYSLSLLRLLPGPLPPPPPGPAEEEEEEEEEAFLLALDAMCLSCSACLALRASFSSHSSANQSSSVPIWPAVRCILSCVFSGCAVPHDCCCTCCFTATFFRRSLTVSVLGT